MTTQNPSAVRETSPFITSASGKTRSPGRSRVSTVLIRVGAPILLAIMLIWVWFPLVDLVLMSFSSNPSSGIPTLDFTTKHYEQLFGQGNAWEAFGTSIQLALVVGIICAILAFILTKAMKKVRRKGLVLSLVILPIFFPGFIFSFAVLLGSSLIEFPLGFGTLLIAHLSWSFPFAVLVMMIASNRMDGTLLDAAADLGAGKNRRLWDIEIPLLLTGIVSAFLFSFLLSLNELPRSLFVGGATNTLPLYVWAQNASQGSNVPVMYALTSIVMVISIVIIFFGFLALMKPPKK